MMREIKFRQPIFQGGKFHSWHYWGFLSAGNFASPEKSWVSGKPSQQYTGLKDKTGKEIYEGDLIEFQEQIWLVQWFYASLRCVAIDHINAPSDQWHQTLDFGNMGHQSYFEIIGNIYENGDLLK